LSEVDQIPAMEVPCTSEKASETTEAPLRFAELLEKMKATGIEEAPEKQTADADVAGQGCLLVFALNLFVFSYVHPLQLGTDARFVYAADVALPHESHTVRFVRVLDLIAVLGMGIACVGMVWALHTKRMTPVRGVIAGLFCQAVAYLMGGGVDFLQCHVQAGGIGSKCHGLWCLEISAINLGMLTVTYFNPRYLFMAVFGLEGVQRIMWASRTDQPMELRGTVFGMAIGLIVLLMVVYFQELATSMAAGSCSGKPAALGMGKERDLEMDKPAQTLCTVPSALQRSVDCLDETGTAAERTKETDTRLGGAPCKPAPCAKDVYATCVEALSPAPPSRRKENDLRVGSGAQNQAMAATEVPKINHTDRKRRRREEQNTLVARLDRLLPDESRRGSFKGAGPRSAGVWGRSFFNVLSGSIESQKRRAAFRLHRAYGSANYGPHLRR